MRLTELTEANMTQAQREAAAEAIAGVRGRVPGPMRAWLHSPIFAARAQNLGGFLRYGTTLAPVASELAIILTARHASSSYVWNSHLKEALEAGLDPAIGEALLANREPEFADPMLRVVYDYATTLLATRHIPQELHERAVAALGETGVVELVGVIGYYSLVTLTVNAFDFAMQPGKEKVFPTPST